MGTLLKLTTITMRCAVLLAIACVVATSVDEVTPESMVSELIETPSGKPTAPLQTKVVPEELLTERVENKITANKDGKTFTEAELAAKPEFWQWEDQYQNEKDGKHRLRQLWKQGEVAKRQWVLIADAAKPTVGRKLLGTRQARRRRRRYRNPMLGRMRWVWGAFKRVGHHKYRYRCLQKYIGNGFRNIRCVLKLVHKFAYRHKLHGRRRWVWGGYRQIGSHRYRHRCLQRNHNGHWRNWKCYWRIANRNMYQSRRPRGAKLAATIYEHANFRGLNFKVYSSVRHMRGFNDKASSIRVYRGSKVSLYEHSSFRGRWKSLGPGNYNFQWLRRHFGNDKLSSVRVHPNRLRVACRGYYRNKCYKPHSRSRTVCAYECKKRRRL